MMCKFKHSLRISQIIQQRKYILLTSFPLPLQIRLFINSLPFPPIQKVFQKDNLPYNMVFPKAEKGRHLRVHPFLSLSY